MRIITTGQPYIDIDAYGGIVAYAELLRAQGTEAQAVSTAILNESIPPMLRQLKVDFHTSLKPSTDHRFVVLDTSDPEHFDKVVALDQVAEVVDHHAGFEDYWAARRGVTTDIRHFGAVCTLVYEHWQAAGLLPKLSTNAATLLAAGILDNTLNFGADISTASDKAAYTALSTKAKLPDDWPHTYFAACEQTMLADLETAVINDMKTPTFKTFPGTVCVGQLVVWDGSDFIKQHQNLITKTLARQSPDYFMNLISLKDRSNRLFTTNSAVKSWLSKLLGVKFEGYIATTSRPLLRKEIIKADIDFSTAKKR